MNQPRPNGGAGFAGDGRSPQGGASMAIRRKLERRGLVTFVAATLSCSLFAAAALLHAWVRTRVTEEGYQLSRLAAEGRELSREHQSLQVRAAELKSPQRIEELARTRLSMGPPALDRVVVLVQDGSAVTRSAGRPSMLAAAR